MSENKTSIMANPFVRRLIPVATAAGLSFAACGPTTEDNNTENNTAANNTAMNNMTSANNTAAGNNTSANNASTNNTAANNATTGNSTTPANNTSPANSTTPVNNTSANNTTPANNTSVNNTTPGNNTTPANNTSPGADGVPDETEIRAFCQSYSDCDATTFMDSYGTIDDCVTSFQEYISEFAGTYGPSCEDAINAYAESYLLEAECIDGKIAIPESSTSGDDLESELAQCINAGGVQLDPAKVTPFCQSYVACEADAFDSVDDCVNETLIENNYILGEFESGYSVDCASAFKAYAEDLLNTFTCQDGQFIEGDGNPALAMDLENKCQMMP